VRDDSDEGEGVRRIGRYILNGITVLSLVLCLAISALWVRSYFHTDQLGRWRRWEDRSLLKEKCSGIVSQDGALVIVSFDRRFPSEFGTEGYASGSARSPLPKVFDYVGWLKDPLRWSESRFAGSHGVFNLLGISYTSGFGGRSASYGETLQVRFLRVPNGFFVAALLVLPLLGMRRYLVERRRARVGRCSSCGYDLRATPGRCPECGMIPTKVKA
jgi:hypothetical protein